MASDEKIPRRLWVLEPFTGRFAAVTAYIRDPRMVHDNGKPVYEYVLKGLDVFQDAVTMINSIASNQDQPETVRQELEALKALIDLLLAKLPAQESDYETEHS